MNEILNTKFLKLIKSLKLQKIQPISIHSDLLGDMSNSESELNLSFTQAFHNDDPIMDKSEILLFRPKYELNISFKDKPLFKQVSLFLVFFDKPEVFLESWKDEELKKIFKEKQIQKILWPFFRQNVHDGMSRLGIMPITLPWII
jgi:hypothetical protein